MDSLIAGGRFSAAADESTLVQTVPALKRRGFGVEVVDSLSEAREAALERIPPGTSVMTFPSVTLEATGIAAAIEDGTRYATVRAEVEALNRATQMREIKAVMLQPAFALGSVHAITRDGIMLVASALGSQLAAYAWGADMVTFVAGTQKPVEDVASPRERIHEHCLPLESERTQRTYGSDSYIGKILEIHRDEPDRTHVVLIRSAVGF